MTTSSAKCAHPASAMCYAGIARGRCRVHETVQIDAMVSKYEPASLPTRKDAVTMAAEREDWARAARERDQPGSAREFELTAMLLRFYANTVSWH
jgi:hypothetical protein